MSLRRLATLMRRIDKNIQKDVLKAKKELALYMIEFLIEKTPVDTSAAISNWQIRIDGGSRVIEPHLEGWRGSTRDFSSRVSINLAKLQLQSAKIGKPITIYNHIDYIGKLNDKYFFVQAALFVGKEKLRARNWLNNSTLR